MKNILLVNPWIYDFAAYDLWLKPWGLLKISSILKKNGFNVYFVDALDRQHFLLNGENKNFPDGTGKFHAEEIKKPKVIKDIPRKYKRYGLPIKSFKEALPEKDVDIILVSSGMTYWYPGAFEAIKVLKSKYKDVPVVLGGVYATLAYEHALEKSGADYVVGNKELGRLSGILGVPCDFSFQNILNETIDYSWYLNALYGVLRISLGCPFNCAYCAQKQLGPAFMLKDMNAALKEISMMYKQGIHKFAFYDDALLVDEDYITSYFENVVSSEVKAEFYTPNGLHARHVTEQVAKLMRKTGFVNPILSLEIAKDEKGSLWHDKVTKKELEKAVFHLKEAGYRDGEYTVYLMLGMPGSSMEDIKEGVDFVHSLDARVSLSEFSPIPGTPMAQGFNGSLKEPLLQNNSVFPVFSPLEWDKVNAIKNFAYELNASFAYHIAHSKKHT